ncbi:MAG: hypothetical protein U9O59_02605 [Actinomycetota bacterium]|nr:hypothetical protein [Actinomycetota bacterium]
MKIKRVIITVFSVISILFGLFGAVFSVGGIIVLNSHSEDFDNVNSLAVSVSDTIRVVAEVLENSGETTGNIEESLLTASDTLGYASEISYDSGTAFGDIADIMGFEILGYKPLEDTEDYFSDIGDDLIVLSGELEKAQEDLKANASDAERTGEELVEISGDLKNISELFDRTIDSFSIYNIISTLKYILIYICVLNIIFIFNGIMFLMIGR